MSRIIITLLCMFLTAVLCADEVIPFRPKIFIKDQKKLKEERIKQANNTYSGVRKNRTKKVIAAMEEYIEAVKKTRRYWTDKGNLEKALIYKELQEKLDESLKKRKDSLKGQED